MDKHDEEYRSEDIHIIYIKKKQPVCAFTVVDACQWAKVLSRSSPPYSKIAMVTDWQQALTTGFPSLTCLALGSWSQPRTQEVEGCAVGGQAGLHNGTRIQKNM